MSDSTLNDLAQALRQDRKRERDHKHKWARGEAPDTAGCTKRRPAKSRYHSKTTCDPDCTCFGITYPMKTANSSSKLKPRLGVDTYNSDFSTDEEVEGASTVPAPDADYTYSYDVSHGPSKGSQVLGTALAKAVDRFETKATEKLIKAEYEIVGDEKEDAGDSSKPVEDDFELV